MEFTSEVVLDVTSEVEGLCVFGDEFGLLDCQVSDDFLEFGNGMRCRAELSDSHADE